MIGEDAHPVGKPKALPTLGVVHDSKNSTLPIEPTPSDQTSLDQTTEFALQQGGPEQTAEVSHFRIQNQGVPLVIKDDETILQWFS